MKCAVAVLLCFLCAFAYVNAASYYVDGTNGNNSNAGTSVGAAFKTVQQCATKAVAGDTCYIRAGTYRETVTVPKSGTASARITFTAYNGEAVTISGLEVVSSKTATGWSQHSANVWKTNLMNWDLTDYSWAAPSRQMFDNQIFVDGQMMVPARWPNIPVGDATTATFDQFAAIDSVTTSDTTHAVITDASLSGVATNFWKGAYVTIAFGMMYQHGTCNVDSNTGTTWNLNCKAIGDMPASSWGNTWNKPPQATNRYYFWGVLNALDAPGEWFYDSTSKTLYMYFPAGKTPANSVVEAKKRQDCLIVSHDYVTVSGINTKGGRITTKDANYLTLTGMDIGFQWAQIMVLTQGKMNYLPTMYFNGVGNTIQDSYIHDSAAASVWVFGSGHKFINNVWARNNYAPQHQAVISGNAISSPTSLHLFSQNTLYETTDQGVWLVPGLEVSYSDFYHTGRQRTDFGPVYCVGTSSSTPTYAKGATVHHNWMHSCYSYTNGYGGCHGLYLDCGCQDYKMYRNVMWDISGCGMIGMGQRAGTTENANNVYAYNTVANLGAQQGASKGFYPIGMCFFANQKMTNILAQNNIAPTKSVYTDSNPSATSYIQVTLKNNYIGNNPGLVDWPNLNFNLTTTSPAKGTGAKMSTELDPTGLPNGVVPDMGAYQSGLANWATPGATIRAMDISSLSISCPTSANAGSTIACSLSIPAWGRKLAPSFGIGLGANPAAGWCDADYSYTSNTGSGACTLTVGSGLTGTQSIYVRLTSTSSWVATAVTVSIVTAPVTTTTRAPTTTKPPTTTTTTTTTTTQAPVTTTSASSGQPDGWVNVPTANLKAIAVGQEKVILGISSSTGSVLRWSADKWIDNGGANLNLASLDVGCDGTTFAVGANGTVYKLGPSNSWPAYGSVLMKQVAVGNGGIIYAINQAGNLMKLTNTAVWTQIGTYANLISLSVGCDGSVWAVDSSNAGFMFNGTGTFKFTSVPGKLGKIVAGDNYNVWALNPYGDVVQWQSGTWVSLAAGKLKDIGVSKGGLDIWGTTSDTKVWRWLDGTIKAPYQDSEYSSSNEDNSTETSSSHHESSSAPSSSDDSAAASTTGDNTAATTGDSAAATTGDADASTTGTATSDDSSAAGTTTTTGATVPATAGPTNTPAPTASSAPTSTTPAGGVTTSSVADQVNFAGKLGVSALVFMVVLAISLI